MVSLSFIVPTAGRPELERCLRSITYQLEPEDEVLIIGDTYDGPLPDTERIVRSAGPQCRYMAYNAGEHDYGHAQMNYGMSQADGHYLSFSDDDDIWMPGVVQTIKQAIVANPWQPLLFRFVNYHGFLCWVEEGYFEQDYVGGHCLVCPNAPDKLGRWTKRYAGDWDFVRDTVERFGIRNLVWRDEIIVVARPQPEVVEEIMRLAA